MRSTVWKVMTGSASAACSVYLSLQVHMQLFRTASLFTDYDDKTFFDWNLAIQQKIPKQQERTILQNLQRQSKVLATTTAQCIFIQQVRNQKNPLSVHPEEICGMKWHNFAFGVSGLTSKHSQVETQVSQVTTFWRESTNLSGRDQALWKFFDCESVPVYSFGRDEKISKIAIVRKKPPNARDCKRSWLDFCHSDAAGIRQIWLTTTCSDNLRLHASAAETYERKFLYKFCNCISLFQSEFGGGPWDLICLQKLYHNVHIGKVSHLCGSWYALEEAKV